MAYQETLVVRVSLKSKITLVIGQHLPGDVAVGHHCPDAVTHVDADDVVIRYPVIIVSYLI